MAAVRAFTQALELRPDFVPALSGRGGAYAELGQWANAVTDFIRATELTGLADPAPWDSLALAQLGCRDTAAYQKTCARMLAMFARSPAQIWAGGAFAAGPLNPWAVPLALHVADHAVRLDRDAAGFTAVRCTTRPDTLTDWQQLVPLTKNSPDEVRAKVFCRTGRYEQAVKLLTPLRTATTETSSRLPTLYLALADHGRGPPKEAKRLLEETMTWLNASPKDKPKQKNRDSLPWTERVQIDELGDCPGFASLLFYQLEAAVAG